MDLDRTAHISVYVCIFAGKYVNVYHKYMYACMDTYIHTYIHTECTSQQYVFQIINAYDQRCEIRSMAAKQKCTYDMHFTLNRY